MRKLTAEMLGTYALVFAGTGAIIVNDVSGGAVSPIGIALTFGLIVLAMIYAVGEVSGAHLNPAVTIGFFAAKRISGYQVTGYIISQCAGAILASCTLQILFPMHGSLGATLPAGTPIQSFLLETILTFLLMFVILSVPCHSRENRHLAPLVVGAVITLEALFAGPVSGASMNPARSLAPAVVSLHFESLWIYLTAPVLGASASVLACRCVQESDCCRPVMSKKETCI
ncbi:MIP/aquaporin family protein [Telmatocola sphagniphila]|nr:aquaporin [Telmatocola sphagniphila]